jgi:hypothetical protein
MMIFQPTVQYCTRKARAADSVDELFEPGSLAAANHSYRAKPSGIFATNLLIRRGTHTVLELCHEPVTRAKLVGYGQTVRET